MKAIPHEHNPDFCVWKHGHWECPEIDGVFNISSKQVGVTANRSTGRSTLMIPGTQINRFVIRRLDIENLSKLITRLTAARDFLKGEPFEKSF